MLRSRRLLAILFTIAGLTLHAQPLTELKKIMIPDDIVPGGYFQVNSMGEIFIIANKGIYNLTARQWVAMVRPDMPVLSFSLQPATGDVDYLSILDLNSNSYGLFRSVAFDSFTQFVLVKPMNPSIRIIHPIQIRDEMYLFWEYTKGGIGFGQLVYEDSIRTAIDFREGLPGPFTLLNRGTLFFSLDNILVQYARSTGIQSTFFIPVSPGSICYDGSSGLYMSTETSILQLDGDGQLRQVYQGPSGMIQWANNKIYNFVPDKRMVQILTH